MKNYMLLVVVFFVYTFLQKGYGQDFSKIKIGNIGYKKAIPKSIVNDNMVQYGSMHSDTRFIAYELSYPSQYSSDTEIGILRIDVNTNSTVYNVLTTLDPNQVWDASIVDMEVFYDKLYVLVSVNFSDVLLLTFDKASGAFLKKEYVRVNPNYTYSNFSATDLQISVFSQSLNTPLIGILGTLHSPGTFNETGYSNIVLLYKYENENSFTQVKFYNPLKWFTYHRKPKIIDLSANGVSIISNDVWNNVGIVYKYDFNTQLVSESKNYSINNLPLLFFSQTTLDGIVSYYGQLAYSPSAINYSPGQSNDIFLITKGNGVNPTTLSTYNNPNFLAFKGDDHANGYDALYTNSSLLLGGYYIKNDQNAPPFYGVLKIDFNSSNINSFITGKAYSLSTKARDFLYDPQTGIYEGFNELYYSLSHNNGFYSSTMNPGGVFERRYVNYPYNELNYFYYSNSFNSTQCNEVFSFVETFDKTLTIGDEQIMVENIQSKPLEGINTSYEYLNTYPHISICNEVSNVREGDLNDGVKVDKGNKKLFISNALDESRYSEKDEISVYPNPFGLYNYLNFSSHFEIRNIEIIDANKRKIFEKRNINNKSVKIQIGQTIASGVYFALIYDQKGKLYVKKIIK